MPRTPAEKRLLPDRDPAVYDKWKERAGVRSRLEAARLYRHMTQTDLADAAEIGIATLRRMERRESGMSVDLLARCAVVLDVPITSLIEAEDLWLRPSEEPPHWEQLPRALPRIRYQEFDGLPLP